MINNRSKTYKSFAYLKKKNNLHLIPEIKYKLDKKIFQLNSIFDFFFFKKISKTKINISLNQLVDSHVNSFAFNRSLLNFFARNEKIKAKLPHYLINFLCNEEIKINKGYSILAWFFECFKVLIKTYFDFYKIMKVKKKKFSNNKNFTIYLDNLNNENFNSTTQKVSDYNIIKFFDKYFENKKKKLKTVFQSFFKDLSYENYDIKKIDIFELNNLFQLIKLTIIFHFKFILSFILIFFGKWQYSLSLYEILKRDIILENNYIDYIDYFIFDNSKYLYRPIWTYSSVDDEKKFIIYYYSSNLMFLNENYNESICYNGYSKMSWINILVWSNQQKKFLQKFIDLKEGLNIEITGPIPSNCKKISLDQYPKYLCVFDVQPYNSWIRTGLGLTEDYYSFKNSRLFFKDLIEVCRKLNIKIIFKRKRLTKNIDNRYLSLIRGLVENKDIYELDPGISVFEIINNSIGSITMPFTSVGYIVETYKKKNLFYDPSNLINNDQVISSKKELENNLIKMLLILK